MCGNPLWHLSKVGKMSSDEPRYVCVASEEQGTFKDSDYVAVVRLPTSMAAQKVWCPPQRKEHSKDYSCRKVTPEDGTRLELICKPSEITGETGTSMYYCCTLIN